MVTLGVPGNTGVSGNLGAGVTDTFGSMVNGGVVCWRQAGCKQSLHVTASVPHARMLVLGDSDSGQQQMKTSYESCYLLVISYKGL